MSILQDKTANWHLAERVTEPRPAWHELGLPRKNGPTTPHVPGRGRPVQGTEGIYQVGAAYTRYRVILDTPHGVVKLPSRYGSIEKAISARDNYLDNLENGSE